MAGPKSRVAQHSDPSTWVRLGFVGRGHGLKGQFYISGRSTPFPSECKEILVGVSKASAVPAKILFSSCINERSVLVIDLASDRTAVEKLTGQEIWAERQQLKKVAEDEYLWADLEGRVVIDINDSVLGKVSQLFNAGASDVLEVQSEAGKTVGIPFVAAYFDMGFEKTPGQLRLVVAGDVFDELWS